MFYKIAEGDVFCNSEKQTSGPRLATLPNGTLMCSFMLNSEGGANDFYPMVAYSDDGLNWSEAKPLWPEVADKDSVFASVRTTLDGRVCIAGKAFPIDQPGESFWSDAIGGMKENKLVYAISEDGINWPSMTKLDLPYYGSAEQPGGMLVDKNGEIFMIYAPYRAIEQKEETKTNQLVLLRSTDGAKTFTPSTFAEQSVPCQYGESWIVRLSDGRLMVSTWQTKSEEAPDQYFLSSDNGVTFAGPYAMPFKGQTTALETYGDAVLVVYNQRREKPTGVWLALAKPDENGFNLIANEPVWETLTTTIGESSGEFDDFTDFAFGEPHVMVLKDGTLLVTLWYAQGDRKGIRYVMLRKEG